MKAIRKFRSDPDAARRPTAAWNSEALIPISFATSANGRFLFSKSSLARA